MHTGLDLLTDNQKVRIDKLFATDDHVQVEVTWNIYQRMIGAYRHPDRAHGKTSCVRISAINLEKRQFDLTCFMFDETIDIPSAMTAIWQSSDGRVDSWGLRRAIGEVDVELDVKTRPSPSVRIYGTSETSGALAASVLRGILSGAVGFVSVPELKTFSANDSALARSFAHEAAVVGRRIPHHGRQISVIVVPARDRMSISNIAYRIKQAYPKRWVTDLFRRQTANWRAAESAAKENVYGIWISSEKVDATYRPPFYRVTLAGDPTAVRAAWEIVIRYVQIPAAIGRKTSESAF